MAVKEISKKTYYWAHVGTILFHALIGVLLIVLYFREKLGSADRKTMVLILGSILLIVSCFSFMPISKNWPKIVIS